MGIFDFVQRKIEDKAIRDIGIRMFTKFWLPLTQSRVDCHNGLGGQHQSIEVRILDKRFKLSVHICEGAGYMSLSPAADYDWKKVAWISANIEESADRLQKFMYELMDDYNDRQKESPK